jgi:hypothetical protein
MLFGFASVLEMRFARTLSGVAVVTMSLLVGGCSSKYLLPDKSYPVAYVTTNGKPAAGLVPGCTWQDTGIPRPRKPDSDCPHEREDFEAALGLTAADACGDIRRQDAPMAGNADEKIAPPVAPYCYAMGGRILVVEYLQAKTQCSHIVGMAFLRAK